MKVDTENELLAGWFSLVSFFEFVGCLLAEHPGVTLSRLYDIHRCYEILHSVVLS